MDDRIAALREALITLDEETAVAITNELIDGGTDPQAVLQGGLAETMLEIGRRWTAGDMFLPEVVAAAEIFKRCNDIVEPALLAAGGKVLGHKVLTATVKGDLHDLGKNMVGAMLKTAGFEVVDLGKDVPTETIVEAVREMEPTILGLSSLLTTTVPEQRNVINALDAAGLAPRREDHGRRRARDAGVGRRDRRRWLRAERPRGRRARSPAGWGRAPREGLRRASRPCGRTSFRIWTSSPKSKPERSTAPRRPCSRRSVSASRTSLRCNCSARPAWTSRVTSFAWTAASSPNGSRSPRRCSRSAVATPSEPSSSAAITPVSRRPEVRRSSSTKAACAATRPRPITRCSCVSPTPSISST